MDFCNVYVLVCARHMKINKLVNFNFSIHMNIFIYCMFINLASSNNYMYRVPQEECARLREGVPYAKVYRYNPKHQCPKWNGYGDNGQSSLKL